MKVIVGLGNPGKEYNNTRHNVGFFVLERFLENYKVIKKKNFFSAECYEIRVKEEKVLLVAPLTYMNLSGTAVKPIIDYFKITLDDVLIIYDDKDIPLGKLKIKFQGSSAGHNGVKNLITMLGTDKFNRLKIGIGNNAVIPLQSWVLGKFSLIELNKLNYLFQTKIKIILEEWINGMSIEKIMSIYNTK